jgi:hypothetical protein
MRRDAAWLAVGAAVVVFAWSSRMSAADEQAQVKGKDEPAVEKPAEPAPSPSPVPPLHQSSRG